MIYLDNNATTPLSPMVKKYFIECLEEFGNPSTLYSLGQHADELMALARKRVAKALSAQQEEVIFTSGGTEANNLAIKGVAYANRGRGNHLITSAIEHPAVLNVFNFLQRKGFQVSYLPVSKTGVVEPEVLAAALRPETILVSIMAANNETGMVQPLQKLVRAAKQKNPEIIFHTDAVQAVGKIPVSVAELGVDLLSLSGHKLHAPKGVGALYIRRGIRVEPLCEGGPQERGWRPGTEPVPLIAALGLAIEEATARLPQYAKLAVLKTRFWEELNRVRADSVLHGELAKSLPNTLNISVPGLNAETAVLELDQEGICIGKGAACSSGKNEPSYVLKAMSVTLPLCLAALRISFSSFTTEADLSTAFKALCRVIVKR